MIEVVEASSETPVCPHCEHEVRRVLSNKIKSRMGVRFLYFCGHCKKVLGLSHRKGFWMG